MIDLFDEMVWTAVVSVGIFIAVADWLSYRLYKKR